MAGDGLLRLHRRLLDRLAWRAPVKAGVFSAAGVLLSLPAAILLIEREWAAASAVVLGVLILDLLDGMAARGRPDAERSGVADWTADRLSEVLLFGGLALANPVWLALPILNAAINIAVAAKGKLVVLPLRHALFLVLLGLQLGVTGL